MSTYTSPSGIPIYFAEWRRHRKMTLQAVGAAVGLTHGSLSKIERGKSPFFDQHLQALAQAYDCRPLDLLSHDPLTGRRDLADFWRSATDEDRQSLMSYAAFLGQKSEISE